MLRPGELSPDQRRTLPADRRAARIRSLYVHDGATRRTCCVSPHKATNTLRNRRFGRLIGPCAEKRVDHASWQIVPPLLQVSIDTQPVLRSTMASHLCGRSPTVCRLSAPFSHGVQVARAVGRNSVPAVCKGYPSLAEGKRHGRTWWFRIDRGIGLRRRIYRQGCSADLRRSCARGLPLRI